jgi:hypothetical protein
MNRRHFLAGFAAAASGLLVPEPVKRYFFAPAGGWSPPSKAVIRYDLLRETFSAGAESFDALMLETQVQIRAAWEAFKRSNPSATQASLVMLVGEETVAVRAKELPVS